MSLWNVYVGGVTEDVWKYHPRPNPDTTIPARGIERFLFDDSDGSLSHQETTEGDLFSPQHLVRHPTMPVLYAAEFARPGRLLAFAIHRDGHLERKSAVETNGALAISAAVHPNGTHAYVGHLGDGVITASQLGSGGEIVASEPIIEPNTNANGPASKIHHVRIAPGAGALIATDFGRDEIFAYPLSQSGNLSRDPITRVSFPEGSSPRQVELHPSGKYAYAVGVGDCHLYVLEAENFVPHRIISRHPVAQPGFPGKSSAAETSLHPDGTRLFVGVRGADSISTFGLDGSGGATWQHNVPSFGCSPRAIELDPSGNFLFVGNWHSNRVVVFKGADMDKLLTSHDHIDVPSPSSFVFVPMSV